MKIERIKRAINWQMEELNKIQVEMMETAKEF